jgi:hypothetical protein
VSGSILGMGACPMGSSLFGYGTTPAAPAATAALLVKQDGTQGDAALLNAQTGDYVLDAYGNKVGDSSVNQSVFLALATVLGSAAVQTMGVAPLGGVITTGTIQQAKNAITAALAPLTSANLITILAIDVGRFNQSGVQRRVRWQTVTTGQIQTSFV